MTTKILFGLAKDLAAEIVVGSKDAIKRVASKELAALSGQMEPLAFENGPDSVCWWTGPQKFVVAQFDNKVSRCMASIRTDLIQAATLSHVPAHGDCLIKLIVQNKQEAMAAGLACCRNWPLYSQKTAKIPKARTVYIQFIVENQDTVDMLELQVLGDGVRQTQLLMDLPCSELNTSHFVQRAKDLVVSLNDGASHSKATIKIISGQELDDQHFGGIFGVGKGATNPPALVIMSFQPKNATKTIALVGKGIVFDTGGLSLKGTAGMCGMKHDMGGAAAIFSAFEASVKQNVPHNVHALLCLAENAIGANAFRNDDILYMYSQKTVEVNNTDAEGRLVLADGVAYASKHLKADIVIDMATLTGAQLITTGVKHAGVLTPSAKVEEKIIACGKATGDVVFPFLYAPELLMSNFDSAVADMKNSVKDRMNAQASCAGHFIESHLHADYKGDYLHIDIAGPGSAKERGTGYGVALLHEFIKTF